MVTYINKVTSWEHPYMEYRGLSTDTKPTDAPVNARFVELDTGVEYYFSGGTWNIAPSPSGGGSGSSQPVVVNDKLVVTLTEEDDEWTADKTFSEIAAAATAGKIIVADDSGYEYPLYYIGEEGAIFGGVPNGDIVRFVCMVDENVEVWAKMETAVGGEKFVVTLTENNGTYTADETLAEIYAASQDGKDVVVDVPYQGVPQRFPLVIAANMGVDAFLAIAGGIGYTENITVFMALGMVDDGHDTWVVNTKEITDELPSYSSSNNGQVLGIHNGEPEWVDPAGGASSWDDLEDKPFYEETIPATVFNKTKAGGKYISGVASIGGMVDLPVKLYYVGEVASLDDLVGAEVAYTIEDNSSGDTMDKTYTLDDSIFFPMSNGVMIANLESSVMMTACVVTEDDDTAYVDEPVDETGITFTASLPEAGVYIMETDLSAAASQESGTVITSTESITTLSKNVVHEIDRKFVPHSWNDLDDRPFYEETIEGFTLEVPGNASYEEGNLAVHIQGDTYINAPVKLYKVGDVYTTEQLNLTTATIRYNGDSETQCIDTEHVTIIERDNAPVAYLYGASQVALAVIVVSEDGTALNDPVTSGETSAVLTTGSLASGTYLVEIDATSFEGPIITCQSITRDSVTHTKQIDQKFLPGGIMPLVVTLTVDGNEDLVGNKTYGEIHSAFKSGRSVIMVYEDSESDNGQAVFAALKGKEGGVDVVHVQYIDGSTIVSSDGAPTDMFKYVYS